MIVKVQENNIHIYGYIYHGDGIQFLGEFAKIDGTYPVLEVYLHTYGGSVFDGNMIFNTLITAKSQVNTTIIGVGASMGAILSQAGTIRRQVSNGFMMIHAATGGTYGTAKDHLNSANLLTEIQKQFKQLLIVKTGLKSTDVEKWLVGDNWFSAEQAKAAKLIDEIIDPLAILDIEIDDPEEIGAEEMYNRFAASLNIDAQTNSKSIEQSTKPQNNLKTNDNNMKKDLIAQLELTGVNEQSSDTAIIAAVKAKFEASISDYKAKFEAENKKNKELVASMKDGKNKTINSLLEAAKVPEAKIELYKSIGENSGIEALKEILGEPVSKAKDKHETLASLINGAKTSASSRQVWNWDKYQEEDPKALENMEKNDLESFKALYKAKFDKEYKK